MIRLAWHVGEGEDWREPYDADGILPEYYLPITLHVNQESREETKRCYIYAGGDYGWINLSLDSFQTGDRLPFFPHEPYDECFAELTE